MPVTVRTAAHLSRDAQGQPVGPFAGDLLRLSCPREHARSQKIMHTSFQHIPNTNNAHDPIMIASNDSFVRAS